VGAASAGGVALATGSFVVEKMSGDTERWLLRRGATLVDADERRGIALFRAGGEGATAAQSSIDFARATVSAGRSPAASPNFLRYQSPLPAGGSSGAADVSWALAHLRAEDAWRRTRGCPSVRVAVLDDGVSGKHPALQEAIVESMDFLGEGKALRPTGRNAHGTACSGIIAARASDATAVSGVAPSVRILAARIAKLTPRGFWLSPDDKVRDAIEWAWRHGAAVVSASWSGGPPVASIRRAIREAQRCGRNGAGTVFAVAAGNEEGPIGFPGNVGGVITVGASNRADERKTRSSADGDPGWGSNHGPSLSLLAPGVAISTTDIFGPTDGYGPHDYVDNFRGTSAAAPHVAGAAALWLSVRPRTRYKQVRYRITHTADPLPAQSSRWDDRHGHGRLNLARLLGQRT
jgi:thermitase